MSEKKAPDNEEKKAKKMRLVWDDSKMETHYANVCNVSSTKEEFNFLFGTSQSWTNVQKDIHVSLSNRLILNPYTAKRLSIMLNRAIQQYEEKMGPLQLEAEHSNNLFPDGEGETH